tara:strand:+ start:992 stop:2020 length:1029 start_codon:yes stop_codon:yes gene_type:complete
MLGLGNSISRSDFIQSASLLLDKSFAAGPAAAYSLRRVSGSYSGPAVQIRRASDNVEVNVNFDSDGVVSLNSTISNVTEETTGSSTSLTTSAKTLGQFVANASYTDADSLGSTDSALVQNWYDQSGNSNDAIQSTAGSQPQIVSNGSLVTQNGKPALKMSSNSIKLAVLNSKATFKFLHDGSDSSTFWVLSPTAARETSDTTDHELFETGEFSSSVGVEITYRSSQFSGTENAQFEVKNGSAVIVDFRTSNGAFNVGQNLCTFFIDADNSTAADRIKVGLNGNSLETGNTQTGSPSTSNSQLDFTIYGGFTAHWQEVIVYNSDLSSSRSDIESEINTFYSIF